MENLFGQVGKEARSTGFHQNMDQLSPALRKMFFETLADIEREKRDRKPKLFSCTPNNDIDED